MHTYAYKVKELSKLRSWISQSERFSTTCTCSNALQHMRASCPTQTLFASSFYFTIKGMQMARFEVRPRPLHFSATTFSTLVYALSSSPRRVSLLNRKLKIIKQDLIIYFSSCPISSYLKFDLFRFNRLHFNCNVNVSCSAIN